jgi:raffinose/stachyose/melibiose transport system permease protein
MKASMASPGAKRRASSLLFSYSVLAFVFAISVFPILWVIMSSFKDNSAILGDPFALPERLGFRAYAEVFTQYSFGLYALNSFAVATVATFASLVVYSMGAYAIAKYDFPGKSLFYVLFTLTLLVPAQSRAEPIFSIILKLGLYDTKAALMIVYQSAGLAMSMFILRATFTGIPKELGEAAQIDGATFSRTFWVVVMPLAKTGLATAGIMMFLSNWNEYFYAMLLTSSPSNRTLPLALGFFSEAFSYDYTKMFAALTIVVVPGVLIYSFTQKWVQASVASSGIKG